jgi:acetylornithine deacetylase
MQPDRLADCLETIERLIAFDTESSKSNLDLIEWIRGELERRGIASIVAPNAGGDKAALFATFGPQIDGGVVLSGHTDVVPVAGQAWASDPFRLRRDGDRVYGRGACDMKGFVGVALALADEFAAAPLTRPIHFLFTYDEETTCLGPLDVIARFGADLPRPACVLVGEPTSMRVADAHKSVSSYVTRVTGKEAHSSRPALGASAIRTAVDLVAEIYRIGADMTDGSPRFDPPGSTVSVGWINGGTARNIIAGECAIGWEFRGEPHLPSDSALLRFESFVETTALPALRRNAPEASITTRCDVEVPGLRPDPGSAAEALAFRLTRSNQAIAVPFATEAGRFQTAGLPVAICGPGSIDQAHQPDEYIEIAQLRGCVDFMRDLMRELSS